MLKLLLFGALYSLFPHFLSAQHITNIQANLDPFDRTIDITYDMSARQGKHDKYTVYLYYSQDGGKTFNGPLQFIDGDLGEGIRPGKSKIATWDCLEEFPSFNGKDVIFKIEAKIDEKYREDRILKLGGPNKAFLSLLLPGLGDYQVREGKGYWAVGALAIAMMGTGLAYKISGDKKYTQYQQADLLIETQRLYQAANTHRRNAIYLTSAAATIWLSDFVLVAIQGARNQHIQRKIKSKTGQTGYHFQYNYVLRSAAISIHYRF